MLAQKPKNIKGNFSSLSGVSSYNVVFEYEGQEIINYDSEEAFLKEKMADRDKKKAGSGQAFKDEWIGNRSKIYEPDFLKWFNKVKPKHSTASDNGSANYTIKVKTNKIYPGYNVGVMMQPTKLFLTISVYETSNPDKVIVSMDLDKIMGDAGTFGGNFHIGRNIGNAYYKGSMIFKKYLVKQAK